MNEIFLELVSVSYFYILYFYFVCLEQEFWSGRRAAANSPESQFELPCKYPRLDGSLLSEESTSNKIPDRRHIHHDGNDIDVDRDRQVGS